eukprot:351373-Chlamydomonas_euryale.AAC.4
MRGVTAYTGDCSVGSFPEPAPDSAHMSGHNGLKRWAKRGDSTAHRCRAFWCNPHKFTHFGIAANLASGGQVVSPAAASLANAASRTHQSRG